MFDGQRTEVGNALGEAEKGVRKARRIGHLQNRGTEFQITVDGKPVTAFAGETIASVLLADGNTVIRHTSKKDEPRSVFCGIGICFDCLVTVDGVPNQRACMIPARPGCVVTRQIVLPHEEEEHRG
jgi:predicted molibdopterin-dependent oxidoreductase YjgC